MVGRYVNLRTEVKPVATEQLLSTFLMQGQYLLSVSFSVCQRTLSGQETPHHVLFGEGVVA